jgi:A/G-specific adenine glycosylase
MVGMTFPGSTTALRTACGCRKSCSSKRRYRRSFRITSVSWSASLTSLRSLTRPSTTCFIAGAILALSRHERFPILDGNVKRVLSRYFGIEGDLSERSAVEKLWMLSDQCTPHEKVEIYTQAIMDIGATVCTRRNPLCAYCPLTETCVAGRENKQHEIPAPKKARARREKHVYMLVAQKEDDSVLLERRPDIGVWGGLWCLPEFETESAARLFATQSLRLPQPEPRHLDLIEHAFTHFDLIVTPLLTRCEGPMGVMEAPRSLWYNPRQPARVGLPAPIKTLLTGLADPIMSEDPHATR